MTLPSLNTLCREHLLDTKWLLAPTIRIGHQWIERLVRRGQSVVNLHPTSVLRLALEMVGAELAGEGWTLASPEVAALIVDSLWDQLPGDGYLGRLERSAQLSHSVASSLLALRMAGCSAAALQATQFESPMKQRDITLLLTAYERFLQTHRLVDEADVLRRAAKHVAANPTTIDQHALVLVPAGMALELAEQSLLSAVPAANRVTIQHPAESLEPQRDSSMTLFRAVGEVNEIREVFRRALAAERPLDDIELLHTDTDTYVPLVYAMAMRYRGSDFGDSLPITFAEGIPVSFSRPGCALAAWLQWIRDDYPQRLLVEMIGEGLLQIDIQVDDERDAADEKSHDEADRQDVSFNYLVRLLRPIAIGHGADQYMPKLDEQIKALRSHPPASSDDADTDAQALAQAAHRRRLQSFIALRTLVRQLLRLSQDIARGDSMSVLAAAARFLERCAHVASALDRAAVDALVAQIREQRMWLERLGLAFDLRQWLALLPASTRVLASGPLPGRMHVAHVHAGGHSGRTCTFVVGLDDRRFPGAALQDPVLLDVERRAIHPQFATSDTRLRGRIDEFTAMLSRLCGHVTLCWTSTDVTDDREVFPSPVILAAYRRLSGHHDADLQALNMAVGPPVSFAPTTSDKSLDASDRWLWRLSSADVQRTDQTPAVESFFPHLAQGAHASRQRQDAFGCYSGHVPQAGQDLNPFAAAGPVLSASAIETAGRCPLAFFFRNGLKLFLPEELDVDPDRWLDPAQTGTLLHDVLRRFMQQLTDDGLRPQFDRDHHLLAKLLHDAIQRWRSAVPPPNENAYRMQYWQLIRTARIFLQAEEEFCRASQPRYFEVALGLKNEREPGPLDDDQPSTIPLPGGRTIRVRGQIDRVDALDNGCYSVWDYKISSGYGYTAGDPFRQGRRMQNVLYFEMIQQALRSKVDPQARVTQFGYFFPSVRAHGLRIHWDAETLMRGMSMLQHICTAMEAGLFIATDRKDDCSFCDYKAICRHTDHVTKCSQAHLEQVESDGAAVPLLKIIRQLRRSPTD